MAEALIQPAQNRPKETKLLKAAAPARPMSQSANTAKNPPPARSGLFSCLGVKDPNKTTKDRKARDIDKLRSEISKICRNRFSLDNAAKDKIRKLAKKHGIKKLLREDWDMPSFSGKARAGGRYRGSM